MNLVMDRISFHDFVIIMKSASYAPINKIGYVTVQDFTIAILL